MEGSSRKVKRTASHRTNDHHFRVEKERLRHEYTHFINYWRTSTGNTRGNLEGCHTGEHTSGLAEGA